MLRTYIRAILESVDEYRYNLTRPNERTFKVTAHLPDGTKVGQAEAEVYGDKLTIVGHTEVHHAHQRKGIATAMYDLMEKESGLPLTHGDIWSSPSAIGLWRKRLGDPSYGAGKEHFAWNDKGEYIVYDTSDDEFYNLGWQADNPQGLPKPKDYVEPPGYDAPARPEDLPARWR